MIVDVQVAPVTDGIGAATGFTPSLANGGEVVAIRYFADGAIPYTGSATATFTDEHTGVLIDVVTLDATKTSYPRAATSSNIDDSAALYAAAGVAVRNRVPVAANSRIQCVIAGGGAAKQGVFHLLVETD